LLKSCGFTVWGWEIVGVGAGAFFFWEKAAVANANKQQVSHENRSLFIENLG
jgi:hypothetical protein